MEPTNELIFSIFDSVAAQAMKQGVQRHDQIREEPAKE